MDKPTFQLRVKLQEVLLEKAEVSMRLPKKDPFDHGVQVGVWQGIQESLQILDSILRDEESNDSRL